MAGDWIKVETATPDKPEIMKLARILNIDRDAAFGKLFRLWAWFDGNSVDGFVDGVVGADVDTICRHIGFAKACESVGWLIVDRQAAKVSIPNFSRHNGQTAKRRSVKTERQRKWRANVDASVDAGESTNVPTREEKRREDIIPPQSARRESARSLPESIDTAEFRKAWEDWLIYWAERHGNRRPMPNATADLQLATCSKLGASAAIVALQTAIERGLRAPATPITPRANARPAPERQFTEVIIPPDEKNHLFS